MCQLSGISKAGTKLNRTRTVDSRLFSTHYSSELNLEHVLLKGGGLLLSPVTVFSQQLPLTSFCVGCEMRRHRECFHKGQ